MDLLMMDISTVDHSDLGDKHPKELYLTIYRSQITQLIKKESQKVKKLKRIPNIFQYTHLRKLKESERLAR